MERNISTLILYTTLNQTIFQESMGFSTIMIRCIGTIVFLKTYRVHASLIRLVFVAESLKIAFVHVIIVINTHTYSTPLATN